MRNKCGACRLLVEGVGRSYLITFESSMHTLVGIWLHLWQFVLSRNTHRTGFSFRTVLLKKSFPRDGTLPCWVRHIRIADPYPLLSSYVRWKRRNSYYRTHKTGSQLHIAGYFHHSACALVTAEISTVCLIRCFRLYSIIGMVYLKCAR